jgi:O-antigen/teichoic acid export membrane protein
MRHTLTNLALSSSFVFSSRLAGAALVFLTQILLARWMGAQELGIYVFAFSWCTLISIITGLGYPATSLRIIGQNLASNNMAHIRGFIRQGSLFIIVGSLLASAVGIAVILSLGKAIPDAYVTPLIITLLGVPVFSILRFNLRIAHALSWFSLAFLPNMLLRPLLFLLLVYATWRTGTNLSAETTMFLQLLALGVIAVGQFVILRRMLRPVLGDTHHEYDTRVWMRVAGPLLLVTLFTQFFQDICIALIGTMLPSDAVAIFNASYRTALFIYFGLNAVNAVTIPRLSSLYAAGDRDGMQHLTALATQFKFWSSLCGFFILVLAGKDILALFGDDFLVGYETMLILATAQLVLAAAGPVDVLLSITGHQDRCIPVFAMALLATIALNLVLVPRFGINGAAITVLLVTLLWTSWLHVFVVRHLKIQPSVLAFKSAFRKPVH